MLDELLPAVAEYGDGKVNDYPNQRQPTHQRDFSAEPAAVPQTEGEQKPISKEAQRKGITSRKETILEGCPQVERNVILRAPETLPLNLPRGDAVG